MENLSYLSHLLPLYHNLFLIIFECDLFIGRWFGVSFAVIDCFVVHSPVSLLSSVLLAVGGEHSGTNSATADLTVIQNPKSLLNGHEPTGA